MESLSTAYAASQWDGLMAYRCQEVQCEIIAPQPVMGKWSQDIFDCCKTPDGSFGCLSWFYPPVAWACLYEKAFKLPYGSCWVAMLVLYVLARALNSTAQAQPDPTQGVILADFYLLFVAIIIALTYLRSKIRRKFQIPGTDFEDCLCVSFCIPCSAIQTQQHLKLNHESPDVRSCSESKTKAVLL
jgi:Cys-rich protein (TIGR01571 family)